MLYQGRIWDLELPSLSYNARYFLEGLMSGYRYRFLSVWDGWIHVLDMSIEKHQQQPAILMVNPPVFLIDYHIHIHIHYHYH